MTHNSNSANIFRKITALLLATLISPTVAAAAQSVVLSDVIKSTGIGQIDLFKNVTAAQLEQLRMDNSGTLSFAVDVNEAADGSEKADSQGIAIQSAVLTVTIAGTKRVYSTFSTQTKALLASGNSTTRLEYYTLIGDTGSSRINKSTGVVASFDSTIRIPVADSLANASSVTLLVTLLTTNTALGDPEMFYDFTNGFEDLAIVNAADTAFLDGFAAGRTDAPAVVLTNPPPADPLQVSAWTYLPSANRYYLVAYEDQYPSRGDYDFNDLTVAYRLQIGTNASGNIVRIDGIAILVTRGADYNSDWHLRLPLPDSASGTFTSTLRKSVADGTTSSSQTAFTGAVDLRLFQNTRYNFVDPNYDFVNTLPAQALRQGPKATFSVLLGAPITASQLGAAPFDPYLYVNNSGYEIHLPGRPPTAGSANLRDGYTTFQDANGLPFAMILPESWLPPVERTDMGTAYPDLITYVTSSGTQKGTWYLNPTAGKVKNINSSDWEW